MPKVDEQIQLCRQYDALLDEYNGNRDGLDLIIAEDFPPKGAIPGKVTKYHVAALRDLVARQGALIEGYTREN